jgi:hypothetical protein
VAAIAASTHQTLAQASTFAPSCHDRSCEAWSPPTRRWADGCRHVFLDIGTNRGVSVRKLFEPASYPIEDYDWDGAGLPKWLCCKNHSAPQGHIFYAPLFDERFGDAEQRSRNNFTGICAFGFEPNPQHTDRLRSIERCYTARGWRVKFFTQTAVSDFDGNTTMRLAPNQDSEHNWGASIVAKVFEKDAPSQSVVATVNLAEWLREHVALRSMPPGEREPSVVAKMVRAHALKAGRVGAQRTRRRVCSCTGH